MLTYLAMKLPAVRRLKASLEEKTKDLYATRQQLAHHLMESKPRPARMVVESGMSEESIGETLAGTQASPTMKAVCAIINARIVDLADTATDRPREPMQLTDRFVPGYSSDERLHDSGGVFHLADLLAQLQDLSKARDQNTSTRAA